jgi:hypothetical protein
MAGIYAIFILGNLISRKPLHYRKALHIRARLRHDAAYLPGVMYRGLAQSARRLGKPF